MDQSEAIRELVDEPAVDRDGDGVGRVADVFVDEQSNAPKWVALRVEGREFLVLAPIGGADLEARPFRLDVEREQVLSAPTLSSDEKHISPDEEAEIDRHYREGVATGVSDTGSGRPLTTEAPLDVDRPLGAGGEAPVEVVRSEEDLLVDTRIVGQERVRLIKRIVTEQVTRTVEVRHEELVVERETLEGAERSSAATAPGLESGGAPDASAAGTRRERIADRVKERLPSLPAAALNRIGSGGGGGAFTGETTEITLMQEELVITKRIVPRERVRVRKEVVTEQREISETLRKEQVTIEQTGRRGESLEHDGEARLDQ